MVAHLGLLFALIIVGPIATKADGGIFAPPNRWAQETGQKAVIVSEKGVETLILSTSYKGDVEDFTWIIPTPSRPEVSKGAVGIFEVLQELTNVYRGSEIIYDNLPFGAKTLEMAPTTTVLEQKRWVSTILLSWNQMIKTLFTTGSRKTATTTHLMERLY